MCCHLSPVSQGLKRDQLAKEQREANPKPPSKGNQRKSKGVGSGAGTQRGKDGRFQAVPDGDKPRNPELPTSVPMPSYVADINNSGMRAMWEVEAHPGVVTPSEIEAID